MLIIDHLYDFRVEGDMVIDVNTLKKNNEWLSATFKLKKCKASKVIHRGTTQDVLSLQQACDDFIVKIELQVIYSLLLYFILILPKLIITYISNRSERNHE